MPESSPSLSLRAALRAALRAGITAAAVRAVAALVLALLGSGTLHAQSSCQDESQCSFKKPNVLLVLDYSSSMTGSEDAPAYFPRGQTLTTRWLAELDSAGFILRYDNGFFASNSRIALARFAHDPQPDRPGTTIATDRSFPVITDGFAVDVPFDGSQGKYLECKASGVEAALSVLRGTPPPPVGGNLDGTAMMLTWTRGALHSAHALVNRTRMNHAAEPGERDRAYAVVLMTDGDWTCPDRVGQGCDENPAPEAALLRADGIPVHVIAFGDAVMQPSLDEVALQGGTGRSIDATSPKGIVDAFKRVLDDIRDSVIVPSCTRKLPRVMITLDASTSMLVGDAPGETKWDKARFALTGNPAAPNPGDPGYVEPVLARKITIGGREVAIEDVVHLGMVGFGAATEQKLIASFGPCMRDNFAWALDPATSCSPPGCTDPYAGSPLTWTFKNSDTDRDPHFTRTTHSYMPLCHQTPGSKSCAGQTPTTFTGEGLQFAQRTIREYKQSPAPFKADEHTPYVNVLITDGQTSEGGADVQSALESLVSDGVDTYVIGFGSDAELDREQLDRYAAWGHTERAIVVDPLEEGGAAALAAALEGVVLSLGIDSCCALNSCSSQPEPPDPSSVCGDGRVEGDEVCDDGADNAKYGHCGGLCDGPHLRCGDGRLDGPERCDDANDRAGDGCNALCELESDTEDDAGVTAAAGARAVAPVAGAPARRATAGVGAQQIPSLAGSGAAQPPAKDDGCGCRIAGAPRKTPGWLGLGLVGLGALWITRRRRRR